MILYISVFVVFLDCWASQDLNQGERALQEAAVYLREGVVEMQSKIIAQHFKESELVHSKMVSAAPLPHNSSIAVLLAGVRSRAAQVLSVLMATSKSLVVSSACLQKIEELLRECCLRDKVQLDLKRLKDVIHNEQKRWVTLEMDGVEPLQRLFHESRRKYAVSFEFLDSLRALDAQWGIGQDGRCYFDPDSNFFLLAYDVLKEAEVAMYNEVNECQKRANLGLSCDQWGGDFQSSEKQLSKFMCAFGMSCECTVPEISMPERENTWKNVAQVFEFFKSQESYRDYDLTLLSDYILDLLKKICISQEMEKCGDERCLQLIVDSCVESGLVRVAMFRATLLRGVDLASERFCWEGSNMIFEWNISTEPVRFAVSLLARPDKLAWCDLYLRERLVSSSKVPYAPVCVNSSLVHTFLHMEFLIEAAGCFQLLKDPEAVACYNQYVPEMQRLFLGVRELSCERAIINLGRPTYASACAFVRQNVLRAVISRLLKQCMENLGVSPDMIQKVSKPYEEVRAASSFYVENREWLSRVITTGEGASFLIKSFLSEITEDMQEGFLDVMHTTALGEILHELIQYNQRSIQETGQGVQFFGEEEYKQGVLQEFCDLRMQGEIRIEDIRLCLPGESNV